MKKVLAIALLIAAAIPSAQAQIVRSTTVGQKQSRKTTWYFRAGVSMNNLTGPAMSEAKKELKEYDEEDTDWSFGTRVGYDFEFGFMKYFGKSDLYWGMELGLGTRGGKYSAKYKYDYRGEEYDCEDKAWIDTYNVKYVPFQIGYIYPITDKLKVDAHLGIFASVDFAGKYKDSSNDPDADESSYEFDFTDDYVDGYRFDAGIQLGVGVWYDRFNLNFTWQRGFAPYVGKFPWGEEWGDKKFQSSNAVLSLGVAF